MKAIVEIEIVIAAVTILTFTNLQIANAVLKIKRVEVKQETSQQLRGDDLSFDFNLFDEPKGKSGVPDVWSMSIAGLPIDE